MLFTRCPDCDTTFRVSDETLAKANGQVRCGRCASVFNAYAELREPPNQPAPADEPLKPGAPAAEAHSHRAQLSDAVNDLSVAELVAQVERGGAEEELEVREDEGDIGDPVSSISAVAVNDVLETALDTGAVTATALRLDLGHERRRSAVWTFACALAVVALGLQVINHFRADLVTRAAIGPPLARIYAMLGTKIIPHWDLKQYQILDWVATAEPNARGQGSLKISARVHNRGPRAQPHPAIRLRLKDRWDKAIASRVFVPAQYLHDSKLAETLMAPGETARAELEVVDPGPDAYGFELDVCVEVETDVLTCGSDEVFL
jgi:predicted Zn finger-like uncharacterized protein